MKKVVWALALALVLAIGYVFAQSYIAQQIRLQGALLSIELQQNPAFSQVNVNYDANLHNGLLSFEYRLDPVFFEQQLEEVFDWLPSSWWQRTHSWSFAVRQGPIWHAEHGIVLARASSIGHSPFEGLTMQGTDQLWLTSDQLVFDSDYQLFALTLGVEDLLISLEAENWQQSLVFDHNLTQLQAEAQIESIELSITDWLDSLHFGSENWLLTLDQSLEQGIWLGDQQLSVQRLTLDLTDGQPPLALGPISFATLTEIEDEGLAISMDIGLSGFDLDLDLDGHLIEDLVKQSSWHWQLAMQGMDIAAWQQFNQATNLQNDEQIIALLADLVEQAQLNSSLSVHLADQTPFILTLEVEQLLLLADFAQYVEQGRLRLAAQVDQQLLDQLLATAVEFGLLSEFDLLTTWMMVEPYLQDLEPNWFVELLLEASQLSVNSEVNDELLFLLEMLWYDALNMQAYGSDLGWDEDWGQNGFDWPEPIFEQLDVTAAYRQARLSIADEYFPNPQVVPLLLNLHQHGVEVEECPGYFNTQGPDVLLDYQLVAEQELHLYVLSDDDTLLLVQAPNGDLYCNDDGILGTLHPLLSWSEPEVGEYRIWVGSFNAFDASQAELFIGSEDPSDELGVDNDDFNWFDEQALPLNAELPFRQQFIQLGQTPALIQQWDMSLEALYPQSSSDNWLCVGYFQPEGPDALLMLTEEVESLYMAVLTGEDWDGTLMVLGPDGQWYCDDDGLERDLDPMLYWPLAPEGEYRIWLGSFNQLQEPIPATLLLSGEDLR